MAYRDFTLARVKEELGLTLEEDGVRIDGIDYFINRA
jgi:hypothetical protein